jgi:ABC-type Fe3+-hydroxamate transport system substrate-binding protein
MDFTDQLNRTITLNKPARRIVSLVPSQTEFLFDLGLDKEVVGITNFCIHPKEKYLSKNRIGGTKSPDIERIKTLNPDLIIANKEENNKADIDVLKKHFPVWVSDVNSLKDAYAMMISVGQLTGREKEACFLRHTIEQSFKTLPLFSSPLSTIYLIWNRPYMAAGNDTFITHLLEKVGLKNIIGATRYPEISLERLQELAPDTLLLSSEPYPFNEKHRKELQDLLPSTKVTIVDGELFSWYGSRLQYSSSYFIKLINNLKEAP